jgi:hypothetical protein
MLVCNVSLRPPRRAIAGELAETAAAVDATTTGFAIFATLVDDPASVHDSVDAYLGEIMVEAASAAAVVNTGLIYATAMVEAATAISTQNGAVPTIYSAIIDEAVAAGSAQDATVMAAVTGARILAASRAGLGSAVVSDSGKTQIIPGIGVVI